MNKIEIKKFPIIKDKNSPFHSTRDKLIYKNYIYNLFRYNQDERKKIEEKNNSNQKFNAIINTISTPIKKKSKNIMLLNLNSYKNNKYAHLSPRNIKNLNIPYLNDLKNSNYFNLNKKNIIPSIIHKTRIRSRNNDNYKYLDLKITDNSSINQFYSYTYTGINNTKNNSKNKCEFIKTSTNRKIKTQMSKNSREKNSKYKYNINTNRQNKNNKKRLISASFNKKMNDIKNKKNEEDIERPISQNKKNKIKVVFYRDVNDMKPRNRFHLMRRELNVGDTKINKMFMRFKKQISKKQVNQVLINWIKSIENKGKLKI